MDKLEKLAQAIREREAMIARATDGGCRTRLQLLRTYHSETLRRRASERQVRDISREAKLYRFRGLDSFRSARRQLAVFGKELSNLASRKSIDPTCMNRDETCDVLRLLEGYVDVEFHHFAVANLDTDYIDICSDCGRAEHGYDSRSTEDGVVCEDCYDSSYRWSEQMDCAILERDAETFYSSARAYQRGDDDVVSNRYARQNRFFWVEGEGWFPDADTADDAGVLDDDDDDDDDDESPTSYDNFRGYNLRQIHSYHTARNVVGRIPSSADNDRPALRLGVELEIEVDPSESRVQIASDIMEVIARLPDGQIFALAENDGSLDHGFEIVTSYSDWRTHEAQWKRLLEDRKDLIENCKSHDTNSCGLHVHIDKAGMSTLHAGKLLTFINDLENRPLIEAIARRYGDSGYAKRKDKTPTSGKYVRGAERYEMVNFANDKTVEFRLFKGTLRFRGLMAALQFTKEAWLFTRDAGIRELNVQAFLKWVSNPARRADTTYLRPYLKEAGFSVPVYPGKRRDEVKAAEQAAEQAVAQAAAPTTVVEKEVIRQAVGGVSDEQAWQTLAQRLANCALIEPPERRQSYLLKPGDIVVSPNGSGTSRWVVLHDGACSVQGARFLRFSNANTMRNAARRAPEFIAPPRLCTYEVVGHVDMVSVGALLRYRNSLINAPIEAVPA